MAAKKIVYVSERAHQGLKLLAAHRRCTMGEVLEALLEEELAELANPWTGPEGLYLQQRALQRVWDDPALDVYNDD